MPVKSRQVENSAATRAALIKIARKLFADRGYADTATEEVVRRARVTRGALYHHFKDKQDLFKAVLLEEEKRLAAATTAVAARQSDPWRALAAGCDAFLSECLNPAVQRIVLIDAPAVLGWEAYRQIDADHFVDRGRDQSGTDSPPAGGSARAYHYGSSARGVDADCARRRSGQGASRSQRGRRPPAQQYPHGPSTMTYSGRPTFL